MTLFADFVTGMTEILTTIQTQTNKTFVPIVISASPASPKTHFTVIFRVHDRVKGIDLSGWFDANVNTLGTKFVKKELALPANKSASDMRIELLFQLKTWHKEGFNLIGGFEDPKKKNTLSLLMYKLNKNPTTEIDLIVEDYTMKKGLASNEFE